jgi:hypothetical protein
MFSPIFKMPPVANVFTDLINDLKSNNLGMPSFINVVVRGPTSLNYLLSANEQLIIKIYANNGLKNIVYNPQSQEPFSCGSTILPFTCEYRNGYSSVAPTDPNYFLDWDQVIFYLPTAAASNAFHIIIPDIF